jgi:hypothetical protein
VSDACLNDALLLELNYLKEDLASNANDRSDRAFIHNAYSVLTACRILYTACHRSLASKDEAREWAMKTLPPRWRAIIRTAGENRLKNAGSTTPQLERDAMGFVQFMSGEATRSTARPDANRRLAAASVCRGTKSPAIIPCTGNHQQSSLGLRKRQVIDAFT